MLLGVPSRCCCWARPSWATWFKFLAFSSFGFSGDTMEVISWLIFLKASDIACKQNTDQNRDTLVV